jgi:hypothetical protein
MTNGHYLDSLPIPLVYILISAIILLAFEFGYFISKRTSKTTDKNAPGAIVPMVSGLLAMLGFVLAFTFSMAAGENKARKQNIIEEAAVIETTYLRADLVEEPARSRIKQYLKEYVDIRIDAVNHSKHLAKAIARSLELHDLLWSEVTSIETDNTNRNCLLLIQSVNQLIVMHEKRLATALQNRIPDSIWTALFIISSLTMIAIGVQAGISQSRRLVVSIPLILAFAALTTIIIDLDRIEHSLIHINQQSMSDLQKKMR